MIMVCVAVQCTTANLWSYCTFESVLKVMQQRNTVNCNKLHTEHVYYCDRYYMQLPDGQMRLEVQAERPSTAGTSGIAIDNFSLQWCGVFCK